MKHVCVYYCPIVYATCIVHMYVHGYHTYVYMHVHTHLLFLSHSQKLILLALEYGPIYLFYLQLYPSPFMIMHIRFNFEYLETYVSHCL